MAAPEVSDSNLLKEAEDVAQFLSKALSCGDKEEAKTQAEKLAVLKVPVSVRLCHEVFSQDPIRLKVWVEDALQEASVPITMLVTLSLTISDLKEKMNKEYGFHPALQTWIIGKRLARDPDTLYSHGVKKDGDAVFLYIKSAPMVQLSREQQKQDEESRRLGGIIETLEKSVKNIQKGLVKKKRVQPPALPPQCAVAAPPLPPKPPVGWTCPICTFVNKPTRPGCEMCGSERPADYKVPPVYQPDEEEVQRLQQEEVAYLQYRQALEDERERNFQSLLRTDEQNLVPNTEVMDCPVCYGQILPGEGATLRDCLHNFCKECLKGTILNSVDAEVTCPYMNEDYTCDCKLQDREIQSLLSQEEYLKFLELRLSIAESRSENSFHCKTPDCAGWCIIEDEVNEFQCQLCQETNCLLCKAIHKDMNCKEYQDDLRIRAENDIAAKQTTEMLNTMLETGEAMHCPKCKIIVQKKDGCSWICCLMCKTEICWVTRQGNGDTSGGCRCRVNGVPCHPNCQNCH